MTMIYVPNQVWQLKEKNHLQFLFHIRSEESGIICIPIKPGMIIYFHGLLLTHQQLYNSGEVSSSGCCLNFSAYTNQRLLCHFLSSINHRRKRKQKLICNEKNCLQMM